MDVINLISKPEGLPNEPIENKGFTLFPLSIPNGPRVHEFLQEMNEQVISSKDFQSSLHFSQTLDGCSFFYRIRDDDGWRNPLDS